MNLDEHWTQAEGLLSSPRKGTQADLLRKTLAAVAATPEGRDRIRDKLASGPSFVGRKQLAEEAVNLYEQPDGPLSPLSPPERQKPLLGLIEHLSPKDPAHWRALRLLLQNGYPSAGSTVERSLKKTYPARGELVHNLSHVPWNDLDDKDRIALLSAARDVTANTDFRNQLERAIVWMQPRSTDGTSTGTLPSAGPGEMSAREQTVPAADQTPRYESGPTSPQPQLPRPDVPLGPEISRHLDQARRLLGEWHGQHTAWLRGLEEMLSRQSRHFGVEHELQRLRDELAQAQAAQREAERLYGQVLKNEISLETSIEGQQRQREAAEREAARLREEVAAAKQHCEAVRRDAEDTVRVGVMEADSRLATFKGELWADLRRCLVEVLDDTEDEAAMSEDQAMAVRRLRRIRDALRDHGIPAVQI